MATRPTPPPRPTGSTRPRRFRVSITRNLAPRPRHIRFVIVGLLALAITGFGLFSVERMMFGTNTIETTLLKSTRVKLLRMKRQAPDQAKKQAPAPEKSDLLVG